MSQPGEKRTISRRPTAKNSGTWRRRNSLAFTKETSRVIRSGRASSSHGRRAGVRNIEHERLSEELLFPLRIFWLGWSRESWRANRCCESRTLDLETAA